MRRGSGAPGPDDGSPPIPPAIRTRGRRRRLRGGAHRPVTRASPRGSSTGVLSGDGDLAERDEDRVERGVEPDRRPQRAGPDDTASRGRTRPARARRPPTKASETASRNVSPPTNRTWASTNSDRRPHDRRRARRRSAARPSARSPGTGPPRRPARSPRRRGGAGASPSAVPVGGSGLGGVDPDELDGDERRRPTVTRMTGPAKTAPPSSAADRARAPPIGGPSSRPVERARRRRPVSRRTPRNTTAWTSDGEQVADRRAGWRRRSRTAARPTSERRRAARSRRPARKTRSGDGPGVGARRPPGARSSGSRARRIEPDRQRARSRPIDRTSRGDARWRRAATTAVRPTPIDASRASRRRTAPGARRPSIANVVRPNGATAPVAIRSGARSSGGGRPSVEGGFGQPSARWSDGAARRADGVADALVHGLELTRRQGLARRQRDDRRGRRWRRSASWRSNSRPHQAHSDQSSPTRRVQFGQTRFSRVRQVGQMIQAPSTRRSQVGQCGIASISASIASSARLRS